MNRTTVSIVFGLSLLLAACGNKGGLYLETDQAIADELQQLDQSLDQLEGLDDESAAPSSEVTGTGAESVAESLDDTAKDDEAVKKAKKKTDELLQETE